MKTSKDQHQKQSIRYWLVEITLTSGDALHFYVKALTQEDANEKASDYAEWVGNDKLTNHLREFKFMT